MEIFGLWVEGWGEEEAANLLQSKSQSWKKERVVGAQKRDEELFEYCFGMPRKVYLMIIHDGYNGFRLFEKYLKNPWLFKTQNMYQLDVKSVSLLLDRYYQYDSEVIREVLSRKITPLLKRDIEEIAEKTAKPINSIRRQWENLRSVVQACDMDIPCRNVKDHIQRQFLLHPLVSNQYACMVFLVRNGFELGKKSLLSVCLEDLLECSSIIMQHWSCLDETSARHGGNLVSGTPESAPIEGDVDKDFLCELKTVCSVLREKQFYSAFKIKCLTILSGGGNSSAALVSEESLYCIKSRFQKLYQAILDIGGSIGNAKDFRDIFCHIIEMITIPSRQPGWGYDTLKHTLEAMVESASSCSNNDTDMSTYSVLRRLLMVIAGCSTQLYRSTVEENT